jgi:hypothetical protein
MPDFTETTAAKVFESRQTRTCDKKSNSVLRIYQLNGRNKSMAIARVVAATAVLAGLAVPTATTAWADTPTMNGSYTVTSTAPGGTAMTTDWSVSACGEGCVYVKAGAGGSQARLNGNEWSMDTMNDLRCADGTYTQFATNAHMTWDATTLAGTNEINYFMPACGHPAGFHQTNKISIKASS